MVAVLELIEPAAPPVPKPAGNTALRVLMVLRPDASSRLGGDTIQVRNTASALNQLGIQAEIAETDAPDARGFDIAHVFGITEPEKSARQIDACRMAGAKVVLSPVWVSHAEFFTRAPRVERVLATARTAGAARASLRREAERSTHQLTGWRTQTRTARLEAAQANVLRSADVLLPASAHEAQDYSLHLKVRDRPFVIVPLGITFDGVPSWSQQRSGVICAARIESRKNQAIMALALRDEPVDVTFVGEIYDYYGDLCKRGAGPRARFLEPVAQPELFQLFSKAEVHCMPSWNETAGLSAFEAATCGAKLVAGDRGSEMEYLGEDAEYADPADPESILAAVRRALKRPPRATGDALDRRLHALTWRRAAEKTLEGYKIALGVPLA